MAVSRKSAEATLLKILSGQAPEKRLALLRPRMPDAEPIRPRLPAGNDHSAAGLGKRRAALKAQGVAHDRVLADERDPDPEALAGNIENFVGFARIPVGVVGPLRINGIHARGDFYVPMATSEGALVASSNRGAYVISLSGGAAAVALTETVTRAPAFIFRSLSEAGGFLAWVLPRFDTLQAVVARTSRHCKLVDMQTTLSGKDLFLSFQFETGDASGQNMVTFATDALCRHLVESCPIKSVQWYVEGNLSGDKKATMLAFLSARGKKVVAESVIKKSLVKRILHANPAEMVRYWEISMMGAAQSGSIGVQGHYANALAAIFIACGQDAACVSEASMGLTRLDVTAEGDLYASVSLPNLIVGTVGGGTHLPTARECLAMMDCHGAGHARKFAEICGATALAGEISIIAALASGEFAGAHAHYGRKRVRA